MRSMNAAWVRSHFGAGGLHEAAADGRHLGSGKRTPFTRPPRNRSWRPPSHSAGTRNREPALTSKEEATGVPEAIVRSGAAEENALARRIVRLPKWESRRETRLSPASFASGGPSCPVPSSRVFGRAERRAEEDNSRERASSREARKRERAPQERREASRGFKARCAGKRRSTSARVGMFRSAEVDRTHRRSRRLGHAIKRGFGYARPSSKEPQAAQ